MYEFPLFRICEFGGGMIIGCIYGQEPDNWKKRDHVRLSVLVWLISMYVFHNLGVTGMEIHGFRDAILYDIDLSAGEKM